MRSKAKIKNSGIILNLDRSTWDAQFKKAIKETKEPDKWTWD